MAARANPCAMEVHPQILIFAGSLLAILLLAGLAAALKLGGDHRLADDAAARAAADEVCDGFAAVEVALDGDGNAALLRDADGRIVLLKRHGNRFAGRMLGPDAKAREDGGTLIVASGERLYGEVRLVLADPAPWIDAIERLKAPRNA